MPLGAKGCTVHANDLNPNSFKYLLANIKGNKVTDKVTPYNMDARDFVRHLVAEGVPFDDVVLNLPALSIEFLDVFVGLFPPGHALPMIHCYCFSNAEVHITRSVSL